MKNLENEALRRFGIELPFYYRYVDDITTTVLNHLVDEFLKTFNALLSRLQFMLEIDGNCLNFLNVTIINANEKFNLYHKLIFSGRYFSFLSLHPLSQKRGVLMVESLFIFSFEILLVYGKLQLCY